MEFWPEFLASSWGKEFVAGGFGGTAGVIAGYPLDTLRVRQQHSTRGSGSAIQILRRLVAGNGVFALYRGMAAPLASVTFQTIFKTEGLRGLYRGLTVTALRDAPAHGVYFWTYEYMREQFHPGCRINGQETFRTMLLAGGLAGVASWICCYPLDVIKTRIQGQSRSSVGKYDGIIDCFRRSVREEGYNVLWRGLGTAVARAFVVNGAIFTAYETALRCIFRNNGSGCRDNETDMSSL
ncbi:hypothetical protein OROGR_011844 [Orobanche gracilis]